MQKKWFIFIGVLLVVTFAVYVVSGRISGNVVNGNRQEITIDMKDYLYSPLQITVKKDVPVRIRVTDRVQGCFRNMVFSGNGISVNKYFVDSKDYVDITFTEGKYTFRCSMNMGRGTLIAR